MTPLVRVDVAWIEGDLAVAYTRMDRDDWPETITEPTTVVLTHAHAALVHGLPADVTEDVGVWVVDQLTERELFVSRDVDTFLATAAPRT